MAESASRTFSCGSGVMSRSIQVEQKGQGIALDLSRGKQRRKEGTSFWKPGRTNRGDKVSHEQQLGVSEGAEPKPAVVNVRVWRTGGTKTQMLFEKAKQVFNGKTPQVDLGEVAE